MAFTSIAEGHKHKWSKNKKFTSFDDGHKHPINVNKRVALPAKPGGHKHILLGKG